MKPQVEIIIPTYNNNRIALSCYQSIMAFTAASFRVNFIQNGKEEINFLPNEETGFVLNRTFKPGENLKWTNAINFMRDKVEGEFVLMMNDDTLVLDHDNGWLSRLLIPFRDEKVAASGPISNFAMGVQNLFLRGLSTNHQRFENSVLSGFCMLVRKSALDEVDWLDETFQDGAEDVDLSFKLRDAGYKLAVCRDVFIYHHGSATAKREYGEWWNSREYSDEQSMKMMRKWGVSKYHELINPPMQDHPYEDDNDKVCREWIQNHINKSGVVIELGPGPRKILDSAIAVDKFAGEPIGEGRLIGFKNEGDIRGNVEEGLPFEDSYASSVVACQLFEHILDPVKLLNEAKRVLEPGGHLVILMPNEDQTKTIVLDPTHVHAYNPETFDSLLGAVGGFEKVDGIVFPHSYNFGAVYRRLPNADHQEADQGLS